MGARHTHTAGPWLVATSNSWRRIVSNSPGGMRSVCEPIVQRDGHPDLYFLNGGEDGPDARLIAAAPELLAALTRIADWNARTMDGGFPAPLGITAIQLAEVRAAIAKAGGTNG